jgi:hypothetical protein
MILIFILILILNKYTNISSSSSVKLTTNSSKTVQRLGIITIPTKTQHYIYYNRDIWFYYKYL